MVTLWISLKTIYYCEALFGIHVSLERLVMDVVGAELRETMSLIAFSVATNLKLSPRNPTYPSKSLHIPQEDPPPCNSGIIGID